MKDRIFLLPFPSDPKNAVQVKKEVFKEDL